jgi:hypothetical protein
MNTLPKCDNIRFPPVPFCLDVKGKYEELINLIQEHIGADCWAFVINDEILFNAYNNNTKSFKEIINENLIRDKLITNVHSLLVEVNRRSVDTRIEIYMFGQDTPYKIMIEYSANERKYNVQRKNSQAFIDKFGEDTCPSDLVTHKRT